ncbi:MAG: hypothetical protein D6675_16685 [Gemmatimonadetes bacterium]|nr:MAG: hypothetical protein D6675_16685 [Gemmatimonadota bacterium]
MKNRLITFELMLFFFSVSTIALLEMKFQLLRVIRYIPEHLTILISTWDTPYMIIIAYLTAFTLAGLTAGALFSYVVHVKFRKPRPYTRRSSRGRRRSSPTPSQIPY